MRSSTRRRARSASANEEEGRALTLGTNSIKSPLESSLAPSPRRTQMRAPWHCWTLRVAIPSGCLQLRCHGKRPSGAAKGKATSWRPWTTRASVQSSRSCKRSACKRRGLLVVGVVHSTPIVRKYPASRAPLRRPTCAELRCRRHFLPSRQTRRRHRLHLASSTISGMATAAAWWASAR